MNFLFSVYLCLVCKSERSDSESSKSERSDSESSDSESIGSGISNVDATDVVGDTGDKDVITNNTEASSITEGTGGVSNDDENISIANNTGTATIAEDSIGADTIGKDIVNGKKSELDDEKRGAVIIADDALAPNREKSASIADDTSNNEQASIAIGSSNEEMCREKSASIADNTSNNDKQASIAIGSSNKEMVSISEDTGGMSNNDEPASTPVTGKRVVAINVKPRIKELVMLLYGISLKLSELIQVKSPGSDIQLEISEMKTLLEEEAASMMNTLDRQEHPALYRPILTVCFVLVKSYP